MKYFCNYTSRLLSFVFAVILASGLSVPEVIGQDVYDQVSNTDKLIKEYSTVYAITNARIIVGNGQTIGNSTIIIRNGLIEAIGSNVRIPVEAEIVDGSGLTVYPGFIDIHTNLGFRQAAGGGRGRGGFQAPQTGQQQTTPEPIKREFDINLRPDKVAIDDIDFNDSNFESARKAGITSAVSINRQGVFPGRGSLVSTLEKDPVRGIIKSPLGVQYISYSNIRRGYPSTLMAVVAFQRQSLMDTKYYMDLEARYEKSGRGMPRPVFDPVLRDLYSVVSGEITVVFPVNSENEIKRAISLAKQFNLTYALSGVTEGYRVIDLLKEENVLVNVSLNYPDASRTTGYSFNMAYTPYEPAPPLGTPTRIDSSGGSGGGRGGRGGGPSNPELDKIVEDQLHANAAKLYEAGIDFVLTAGGEYDDFLSNLRHAVNAGLPAEAALAKLTTEVAEILGVSDILGTVESGKIANLILTNGDIFNDDTVIKHVFIDGKKEDMEESAAQERGRGRRGRGGR